MRQLALGLVQDKDEIAALLDHRIGHALEAVEVEGRQVELVLNIVKIDDEIDVIAEPDDEEVDTGTARHLVVARTAFQEISSVPDFSRALLADNSQMAMCLDVTLRSNTRQFRSWFHSSAHLSEKEILSAYVDVLVQVSWIKRAPTKVLRYIITTAV